MILRYLKNWIERLVDDKVNQRIDKMIALGELSNNQLECIDLGDDCLIQSLLDDDFELDDLDLELELELELDDIDLDLELDDLDFDLELEALDEDMEISLSDLDEWLSEEPK